MNWDGSYPVKCCIIDVDGLSFSSVHDAATPEVSVPHIGKRGSADKTIDGRVTITLEDGSIIYGDECWWEPLK